MALPIVKTLIDLGTKTGEVVGRVSDGIGKANIELNKVKEIADKISELRKKMDGLSEEDILKDDSIPSMELNTADISPELKDTAIEINNLEDKISADQVQASEVPSFLDKVGSLIDSLQDFVDTLNKTLESLKTEIEGQGLTEELKEDFQNLSNTFEVAQNLLERALDIRDSLMDIASTVDAFDSVDLDEEDEDDFKSDGE